MDCLVNNIFNGLALIIGARSHRSQLMCNLFQILLGNIARARQELMQKKST